MQADADQVTLAVDIPPDLPLLDVDADRLGQVFSNLLGNALRYTPTGGRITVHAAIRPVEGLPRAVVVEVADTGKASMPQTYRMSLTAFTAPTNRATGPAAAPALTLHW